MAPLDRFAAAVEAATGCKPRQCGKGWRVDCPTGHRSRGTLAYAEGENGCLVMRCHAGCEVSQIVGACGLELSDLYPERLRDSTPEGRRIARDNIRVASVIAAASVLGFEAKVIAIAGADLLRGCLADADLERARVAVQRIDEVRTAINAR